MRVIADRYQLRESLGSGGMAHVHAALDTVLDRVIAIKLLRQDIGADPILRERFLREARLAGSLNHRNIVRVYDAGVDTEIPWMAMELVEGPSLRQRMNEIGPYPSAAALPVMEEVLAALEAAHQANVVHRDVKPANILLGDDGAKLGDFGIAKSLEAASTAADLTQINQFLGTPKYTAPEVAMGEQATRQSDVYAAAVVFWEMLAGRPPFEHENPLTLAMMHRTDPLPLLAEIRPDLPADLVAALEMALEKEPGDRPLGAAGFSGRLSGTTPTAEAATQVLARGTAAAAVAQSTPVAPIPQRPAPRPPAPTPVPSPSSGGGGWGLAILVAVLVGIAVVAFTLVGDGASVDPAASPSPSASATTPEQAPDPADTAPVTEPADPVTQPTASAAPVVPPSTTEEPTPEPTASEPTTPPEPTADPTQPPPSAPEPTADPIVRFPYPQTMMTAWPRPAERRLCGPLAVGGAADIRSQASGATVR